MELTKNIFFNTDKLVENTKVKISYTGNLFQNGAEEVYIHYGFGLLWNNVSEQLMKKTELGFQAEIELPSEDSFNFCFNDGHNTWDNNDGNNYIFSIEKIPNSLAITEDTNLKLTTTKKLRKTYILSKKLRLAVYKIITYLPKLISGNYKRKLPEQ